MTNNTSTIIKSHLDNALDILPPIITDTASALVTKHSVPLELALSVVLSVANLPTTTRYLVDTKVFGIIPTSLYIMPLVASGGRKSTILRDANRGFDRWLQEVWEPEALADKDRYEIDSDHYDEEMRDYKRALKNKEIAIRPSKPRPPLNIIPKLERTTTNGIVESFSRIPFLSLTTDEAVLFFGGHSFSNQNTRVEFITQLTKLWDKGTVSRNTGVVQESYRNRAATLLGLAQPEAIADIIKDPVTNAQGFWNRVLVVNVPPFQVQEEFFVEFDPAIEAQLDKFAAQFVKLMKLVQYEKAEENRHFELHRDVMDWDRDAMMILRAVGTENNRRRNECAASKSDLEAFVSRLTEQMMRIAATVAAFRGSPVITQSDAEAGYFLSEWFWEQKSNQKLVAASSSNWLAEKLLDFIEKTETEKPGTLITKTYLNNFGPAAYRNLELRKRKDLLKEMTDMDLIKASWDNNGIPHWERVK